ncbi:MAG TPA: hypothetical protein VG148_02310 [Pyrinomonadaceae bacterium]|nr:hypothetical protein [Pyrinomonadaceae bacterium]
MTGDFFSVLLGPAKFFMERPALAFVPAALFGLLFLTHLPRRRRGERKWSGALVFLAAAFWFGYACWESYMYRWSKTVVAPIRVDLLLFAPGIYVATAVGLVAGLMANTGPRAAR